MSYNIPKDIIAELDRLPANERPERLAEIERIANMSRTYSTFPDWSEQNQHAYLMAIAQKRINIGS